MELKLKLMSLVQREGVDLKKRGQVHFGLCPFHEDKKPSFAIYEDSNRFVCFGCGEKGDAIDFVRKLKGLTFKEALHYLSVDNKNGATMKDSPERNKQSLLSAFRKWENDCCDELATDYRVMNEIFATIENIKEAELHELFYNRLPVSEYHMDIILFGNDEEKFELFKEIAL